MQYISHPITRETHEANDYTMFADWQKVNFVVFEATECLDDKLATLKNKSGEILAELPLAEYFAGKPFILQS